MAAGNGDIGILRELARRYAEVTADPIQDERRELWRRLNSLEPVRPLIYLRGGECWAEVPEIADCRCQDPFFRSYEWEFRKRLFHWGLGDDFIFEPFVTVRATYRCSGWGLEATRHYSDEPGGSWKAECPIRRPDNLRRLRRPRHEIDEEATARDAAKLGEAVGDILTVDVDRAPAYRMWTADLSTDLGHLRGIEQFMLDMMDRPAWLHALMAFLRDGVLAVHEQAETAGDWGLSAHENQAMPYARGLRGPAANTRGVKRRQLWGYMAAQEFTLVSPAMHEEFLLAYQRPILEQFGLAAYGCCEDLTRKIDILRSIRNLRRIAVAPAADVTRCTEQIGRDYVVSYRPNPARMVCCGFDGDSVRARLRRDLTTCRGLNVDVTLKDAQTIQGQPQRLADWVRITREVIDDCT